jgi:uncharacterized protein (DUF433 family)
MARTRTFRLPDQLIADLQDRANERGESANALAERLLGEGLRRDRHPLVDFWDRAGGRSAMVLGTRLEVAHVIDTWLLEDKSITKAAEYFEIPEAKVQAAVSYYAEFQEEIDEWRRSKQELADREHESWLREQALLR